MYFVDSPYARHQTQNAIQYICAILALPRWFFIRFQRIRQLGYVHLAILSTYASAFVNCKQSLVSSSCWVYKYMRSWLYLQCWSPQMNIFKRLALTKHGCRGAAIESYRGSLNSLVCLLMILVGYSISYSTVRKQENVELLFIIHPLDLVV